MTIELVLRWTNRSETTRCDHYSSGIYVQTIQLLHSCYDRRETTFIGTAEGVYRWNTSEEQVLQCAKDSSNTQVLQWGMDRNNRLVSWRYIGYVQVKDFWTGVTMEYGQMKYTTGVMEKNNTSLVQVLQWCIHSGSPQRGRMKVPTGRIYYIYTQRWGQYELYFWQWFV